MDARPQIIDMIAQRRLNFIFSTGLMPGKIYVGMKNADLIRQATIFYDPDGLNDKRNSFGGMDIYIVSDDENHLAIGF